MPGTVAPSTGISRTPIDRLAASLDRELRAALMPIGRGFSYFTAVPVPEEDLRELLHEPIAAMPPSVCETIAPVRIVLAPYLEQMDARRNGAQPVVALEAPAAAHRLRSVYIMAECPTLFFAIRDESPAGYHQIFFNTMAHLLSRRCGLDIQRRYTDLLHAEIEENVRGEVGSSSWELKQILRSRAGGTQLATKTKAFRDYVTESFADTMTLYMHGICCDIDVETGPRQMPSRWLRKRLEALYGMFPPPAGRAVLPEHLSKRGIPLNAPKA